MSAVIIIIILGVIPKLLIHIALTQTPSGNSQKRAQTEVSTEGDKQNLRSHVSTQDDSICQVWSSLNSIL